MRVYEIAKELGVSSKEVVVFLKDAGFDIASHMSILSDDAHMAVKKKFSPNATPIAEKSEKKLEKIGKETEADKPVNKHMKIAQKPTGKESEENLIMADAHKLVKKKEETRKAASLKSMDQNTEALDKEAFEKIAFGEAPEIIAEEVNLEGLSKGREKIDRFLVKRSGPSSDGRSFRRRSRRRRFREVKEIAPKIISQITIERSLPLFEAADLMGKMPGELITVLLKRGMICNRNHILEPELIKNLADQFGIKASIVAPSVAEAAVAPEAQALKTAEHLVHRAPVVVVMGHVDHGKTTLLDYIRKMNVAGSERGGITQHLGAYEVSSTHGKIVFIDTPGHEAFSYIRERGSRVTDIVVLVVAVDDGIKPQTLEAIRHAKTAEVPIIVAVNKIDKAHSPAAIETVKRQLAQQELMPEDWGGQTIVAPISAKTGQGVDNLLELIVLQSQLMELQADPDAPAKAFVLESKVERGYGPVATVLCMEGTLKQGDFFTCGGSTGKVRLLINSRGVKIPSAGPAMPVQVVGFDSFNAIGDWLHVVPQDVYAKARSGKQVEQASSVPEVAASRAMLQIGVEKQQSLNLIIKTDTRGSKEALMGCIDKLSKLSKEVKCPIYVVSSGIGDISENDVEFAANTNAMIVGLHVKPEKNAISLAKQKNVTLLTHHIIYHLVEDLEKILQGRKEVEIVWNKVGEAVVKKVFDIKGVGVIAGCYMRDGVLSRDNKVVCMRDGQKIGEGKITSLQRDKKTVKEVHAGYECGFMCDSFNEWMEGDTVLCYAQVKQK